MVRRERGKDPRAEHRGRVGRVPSALRGAPRAFPEASNRLNREINGTSFHDPWKAESMIVGLAHPGVLRDRKEAGEQLAARLAHYREQHPVVLALPRGGVVVGFEIAQRLEVPLEVLIVRKIGAPDNPEYGLGALVEDGTRVLDEHRVREAGYTPKDLEPTITRELAEIRRRARAYRGDRPAPDLRDRVVILVDDGVATGGTLRAAIHSVRAHHPRRIIVALGVAPRDAFHRLGEEADEVVVLATPEVFFAVGEWYERFPQVSDAEVQQLLERDRRPLSPST
jgi:putative phosphoribosyl transferase